MQHLNVLLSLGILLNIGSSTAVQYSQTVPEAGVVPCPGDRVVLTCITNTGHLVWRVDGVNVQLSSQGAKSTKGSFLFEITNITGSSTKSTATNGSVTVSHDGTMIGCSDTFPGGFIYLRINVTGPPALPVNNITIEPINNSTVSINWIEQQRCIHQYNITITSNGTYTEYKPVSTSSTTIPSLIIGTNYSFIIIPIDTIGREGPPSSLIQYIWNVPAQVVNISWYQISTECITIWWNNTQDSSIHYPPVHYIINVDPPHSNTNNTTNTNINITGLPLTDTNYTVTIIPVNIIGYGPSTTVNVSRTSTMTSSSVVPTSVSSSVTLTTDISTSTSSIYILSTSITVSASSTDSSSYTNPSATSSSTLTTTGTSTVSTTRATSTPTVTPSTMIPSSTSSASGSNTVPIISGAIGTVFVIIIIIIIIILVIILVYTKRHRIKNKESHTANGNGNKTKGVTGSSYRNNNIELQTTDPTYATPTTEYTPAAASTVRTLQGGDGPPSYPPPPPTGQYSVLRGTDDDDEVPPPVPAYNPNGVQEYSELRREGEKRNKRQQQGGGGAGPLYSTLNQDVPPPVPPAYNPEGVQEYSVLKREGENKNQQSLSATATGLYSTINKDTNTQLLVDESAHKPVYADLSIAGKGKRPQAAPTQEQPVVYASVNNKSVPPSVAPDKVLYADLSVAAGNRTPRNKPPTEERVVYAAVNGNRKSTTQELIMDRLGGLDIPPPIPPKPKP